MADYIYTLETRLTPEQMRGVTLVQDIARAAELNIYLTGGAVRDILTGFSIRDLDFTLQGNPLKLQKDLERAGAVIHGVDEHTHTLYLNLAGSVRAESRPWEAESKGSSLATTCWGLPPDALAITS